jgi:hypothetical protein
MPLNPYLEELDSSSAFAKPDYFNKIVSLESGDRQFDDHGNPLTSPTGAIGAAQVMPNTAKEAAGLANVPFDEHKYKHDADYNKLLGKTYFEKQLETFKDPSKAAAAYNAGPQAVSKAIDKYGDAWLDHLPQETQKYVKSFSQEKLDKFSTQEEVPTGNPYLEGATNANPYLQVLDRPSSNPYLSGVEETNKEEIGTGKAFAKSAGGSAATALAAAPAMVMGARIGAAVTPPVLPVVGPFAKPIGGLIGGIAGFVGGEKLVSKAFDALPEEAKQVIGYDKATREKEIAAHPTASWRGELAGNAVLFGVGGLEPIVMKSGKVITPLMQRAGIGAAMGGIEAGGQALSDEPMDAQKIAEATAFGGVFAKPTAALKAIETRVEPFVDKFLSRFETASKAKQQQTTNQQPQFAQSELDAKPVQQEMFDTNIDPSLASAGDVFATSTGEKNPIEAIKITSRELDLNKREAKIWRSEIENEITDPRIRERMSLAIEKDKPTDVLLTDAEREKVLNGGDGKIGLRKALENLENKTNFKDEADRLANADKISRLKYVIDKFETMPSEEPAIKMLKTIQSKLDNIGKQAQREGLMENLRQNYVTHVLNFAESKLNKADINTLLDRIFKTSSEDPIFKRDFAQRRIYKTIRDLEARLKGAGDELGLDVTGVKVERDLAKIVEIYQESMGSATIQKKLVNHFLDHKIDGSPVMGSKDLPLMTKDYKLGFENGYKKFEGKGSDILKDVMVHPDIVDPLKFIFRQSDPNLLLRGLGSVSMLSKFINTAGSLFHATSLFVARATAHPQAMLKEIYTAGRGTRLALEELEHNGASEAVKLAIRSGLKVATEDIQRSVLKDMGAAADQLVGDLLGKAGMDVKVNAAQRVINPVQEQFLDRLNRFTWDYMHAGGKMHLWQEWFTKIKARHPELSDEQIAKEVSSFVNNTLGGLDWLNVADQVKSKYARAAAFKALNIQGRDWAQIALFAPDWTLSTLRSFTRALPKELMKPQNWELRQGLKGVVDPTTEADLARRYVLTTAMLWLTILNGFNYAFTGRPIWTNKDPTRVDLGDGTSIQMAKHSMEAAEWLLDPEKTAGNKLGFWPKAVITMTTGKAYPSPRAPMIKDNTAFGRLKHSLSAALPFQVSAGMNAPPGERMKRIATSMLGIPIYGQTNRMNTTPEVLMERKLKRQETRQENRLKKIEEGR